VESELADWRGDIRIRVTFYRAHRSDSVGFVTFFFSLFLSPRFFLLTIFLESILLVCFLSNNTAILAFIGEERVLGRKRARRQISFPRLWWYLIDIAHFWNITFVRPPCKPSLSTAQIPALGTDEMQHRRKDWNSINDSFYFSPFSFSVFFSIYLFRCICYNLKNLGGGSHAATPSVKKQCWNVISWRGQPKKRRRNLRRRGRWRWEGQKWSSI